VWILESGELAGRERKGRRQGWPARAGRALALEGTSSGWRSSSWAADLRAARLPSRRSALPHRERSGWSWMAESGQWPVEEGGGGRAQARSAQARSASQRRTARGSAWLAVHTALHCASGCAALGLRVCAPSYSGGRPTGQLLGRVISMGAQLELIASEPPATRATSASGGEREKQWKAVESGREESEGSGKHCQVLGSAGVGAEWRQWAAKRAGGRRQSPRGAGA